MATPTIEHQGNPEQGTGLSEDLRADLELIAPILERLTPAQLTVLDNLNKSAQRHYEAVVAGDRQALRDQYLQEGEADIDGRVTTETSTDDYARQMHEGIVGDFDQDVARLLPSFVHVDSSDPSYADQVEGARAAISRIIAMPRERWQGDVDEGRHVGNGVIDMIHGIKQQEELDRAAASGSADVEPQEPAPTPQGRATVPPSTFDALRSPTVQVPRVPTDQQSSPPAADRPPAPLPLLWPDGALGGIGAPPPPHPRSPNRLPPPDRLGILTVPLEERESTREVRYGAQVGDKILFKQKRPDGSTVLIEYTILGFPDKREDEKNAPVKLNRRETVYDANGNPGPTDESEYYYSEDHIKHLGKDVEATKEAVEESPTNLDAAIDLQQYWEDVNSVSPTERKERIKKWSIRVVGAVAVAAAIVEQARHGQDVSSLFTSLKDIFNDTFYSSNGGAGILRSLVDHGSAQMGSAPGLEHGAIASGLESAPAIDTSGFTAEQMHVLDLLNKPIPDGIGGEAFYNSLGLSPDDWYAHEAELLEMAPNDFYKMPDGHVGLANHEPQTLSLQAQIAIGRINGLW